MEVTVRTDYLDIVFEVHETRDCIADDFGQHWFDQFIAHEINEIFSVKTGTKALLSDREITTLFNKYREEAETKAAKQYAEES